MRFERDLSRAQQHLDNMAAASNFSDYAHEWTEFLYHLERIWERAFHAYKSENRFQTVTQKYRQLRKRDPLLRYLKQARNAETHTLQGTLSSSLNVSLREKFGQPFRLSRIGTTLIGGCLTIDIESSSKLLEFDADVFRGTPSLARIQCRKKWYNPPSSHLGNPLATQNPVVVGKIGLEFCRGFVHELGCLATKKTA